MSENTILVIGIVFISGRFNRGFRSAFILMRGYAFSDVNLIVEWNGGALNLVSMWRDSSACRSYPLVVALFIEGATDMLAPVFPFSP